MRLRRKQLLMDLLLSISGYLLGRSLVQHTQRPGRPSPCTRGAGEPASANLTPVSLAVSDDSLMIGVMTSRKNLATRASAIYSTWGREVPGLLLFYIGSDHDHPGPSSRPFQEGEELLKDGDSREGRMRTTMTMMMMMTSPPAQNSREGSFQEEKEEEEEEGEEESGRGLGDHPAESAQPESIQVIKGLPVVQLQGVSDQTYPPRGKSFAMIRHMVRHFGSSFRWFLRADDDVYIRYEELVKYLHSLDNAQPRYIGQPGIGIPTERGRLGLNPGSPYCMGGPGVVFSRPALRLLVPHLKECARDTVTSHEDTELGRCVFQHVKIACTANKQMRKLFYQDYTRNTFTGTLTPEVSLALTLHPVKDPRAMFRLHMHFHQQRLQGLQTRASLLETHINQVKQMAADDPTPFSESSPRVEALNAKFTFDRQQSVRDFVARTTGIDNTEPTTRPSLENWLEEFLRGSQKPEKPVDISVDQKTRWARMEVLMTDNPVWMYAVFNKRRMIDPSGIHRSRIPIMNAATRTVKAFKKANKLNDLKANLMCARYQSYTLPHGLQHVVTATHDQGFQSFLLSSRFQPLQWSEEFQDADSATKSRDGMSAWNADRYLFENDREFGGGGRFQGLPLKKDTAASSAWPTLYVLVPLYGRHQTYLTFLKNLARAAAKYPASVRLRVALFADTLQEHRLSLAASRGRTLFHITVVKMKTQFSRAAALNKLAEGLSPSSVLIFVDVDLVLTDGFLFRVALTVKPGQAYFPIMYSRYSPSTVCYGASNCTIGLFDFSSASGFWRSFSYGMAGLTARDLQAVGGFNAKIVGWGKEDVDFFDRCVQRGLKIFRAPDLGLIHQFHDKSCDQRLPPDQLRMCRTSRNALIGSDSKLTQMVLDLHA